MKREELLKRVLDCCRPRRVILYGEKFVVDGHDIKSADLCIILDHCNIDQLERPIFSQG